MQSETSFGEAGVLVVVVESCSCSALMTTESFVAVNVSSSKLADTCFERRRIVKQSIKRYNVIDWDRIDDEIIGLDAGYYQ